MTTVLQKPPAAKRLTYEAYITEAENNRRYDILDGKRVYMAGVKWWHQRVSDNLTEIFRNYERSARVGKTISAPFDVMIRRRPLRTRQPDVFFISHTKLREAGDYQEAGWIETAPELVVEIVSDSERENILYGKIADYCAIGVEEGWIVRRDTQTVEVLRVAKTGYTSVRIYGAGERVQSLTLPDFFVDVDAIFAE